MNVEDIVQISDFAMFWNIQDVDLDPIARVMSKVIDKLPEIFLAMGFYHLMKEITK